MAGKKAWFHTKAFPKLRAATTVVNSAFAQPPLVLQVCGAARKCAFHVVLSRVLREDREFMTWVQRGRFLVSWQWPRLAGLGTFTVLLFQLCIVYYSLQLHKCLLPSVFYLVKKKNKKGSLTIYSIRIDDGESLSKRLLTLLPAFTDLPLFAQFASHTNLNLTCGVLRFSLFCECKYIVGN